ncbi:uncharacterized protein LOC125677482 [Ostrea edulis]|uniref:uncharacterized protein LOC125677482 n=1 Tax=Ostrea edulis TaxID=37623 RepID=UPI0024AFCF16|nr:uncharacterized protein LOC125677482 [Ostrea edulis]
MYRCMMLFFLWYFSVSDAFLLSGPSYHSTPIPQNGGGITAPEGSVMHILLQDVALLKQELATALNQITFLQAELKEQRKLYKSDIEILRHDVENLQRFTKSCNRSIHQSMQDTAENISILNRTVEQNAADINAVNETMRNVDRKLLDVISRENTLKQSIRFEVQQELRQNKQDIVNNVTALGSSIDASQKQVRYISLSLNDVSNDLRNVEHRQKNTSAQLVELQKNKTEMKDEIVDINHEISQLQNNSRSTKLSTNAALSRIEHLETDMNTKISFTAARTDNKMTWKDGEIVLFSSVIDSEGGGYNPSTGVFTVPQIGTYLFFCNIATLTNNTFNADIVVNGEIKERLLTYAYGRPWNSVTSSNLLVIRLQLGDKVYVKYEMGSYLLSDQAHETTFSGIRIK